ncbi:type VI secretion system tip protein VgrG [Pendulispora brunnea]|uniref:Type VI secretion system tip protein VgrG n=1 Tax=Pendulispora brunnea TaxID=2905690 RepID=A0ABZ2JZS7_9BACT
MNTRGTLLNGSVSLLAANYDDLRCRLRIANVDEAALTVTSFEGREGLSSLFSYTIAVVSEPEDVQDLEVALGSDASFTVARGGNVELVVHGMITEVVPDGAYVGEGRASTSLVLEPRLANLRYSGGYQIFQRKTVEEIIRELVRTERIQTAWHVYPPLATHEYTVQADETDLDFLARLAAHEGLHYYFDHTPDDSILVFTNRRDGFADLPNDADLDFRHESGAVSGEHVCSIQRAQRVRTGAIEQRDYDFRNPSARLQGRAELDGHTRRERRTYAAGFRDMHDLAERRAQIRLGQERADAFTLTGAASTLRFFPGKTFTLHGHRDGAFNRKLLITEVSVAGKVHGALSLPGNGAEVAGRTSEELTRFSAVPAEMTIHPPHLPKPNSHLESARVVGPQVGDPYVDEYGRIKVQFHWDRDGKHDENSSCWIRMMTPVANFDEGFWQAHKVGSEVLVDFIDGDIDRPVVIGAVYNAIDAQPYKMPVDVANSTWKTKSVPGGGGHNEITQDNHAGAEKIYIHAQRNMDVTVQNAHTENIGGNKTCVIGKDRSITIHGSRTATIDGNDTTNVGGSQTASAKGNQTLSALREQSLSSGLDQRISSNKDQHLSASMDQIISCGRNQTISSQGDQTITAIYNQTIDVTGDRELTVRSNDKATIFGTHTFRCNDQVTVNAKHIDVTVTKGFTVWCGKKAYIAFSEKGLEVKVDGPIKFTNREGAHLNLLRDAARLDSENVSIHSTKGTVDITTGGGCVNIKAPTNLNT